MQPGETIQINKAKVPTALVFAGKQYIDEENTDIEFSNDYKQIKKLAPWITSK